MSGLTEQDGDALRDRFYEMSWGHEYGLTEDITPVVEEIVARHVEAFREQAAAELDRRACGGTAFNAAAQVIRDLPR